MSGEQFFALCMRPRLHFRRFDIWQRISHTPPDVYIVYAQSLQTVRLPNWRSVQVTLLC